MREHLTEHLTEHRVAVELRRLHRIAPMTMCSMHAFNNASSVDVKINPLMSYSWSTNSCSIAVGSCDSMHTHMYVTHVSSYSSHECVKLHLFLFGTRRGCLSTIGNKATTAHQQ